MNTRRYENNNKGKSKKQKQLKRNNEKRKNLQLCGSLSMNLYKCLTKKTLH